MRDHGFRSPRGLTHASEQAARQPITGSSARFLTEMGEFRAGMAWDDMPVPEMLERARAAIRLGDAATARRALEAVDPADAAAREALAQVCYLELDFPGAIEAWEAAYPVYHAAGDAVGALRVARTLAYLYLSVVGDDAVAGGWLARARTLLAGQDGVEAGWVALNAGMFDGDRAAKEAQFPGGVGPRPPLRRPGPGVDGPRLPRREPGARRPHRGGHGPARRGARRAGRR